MPAVVDGEKKVFEGGATRSNDLEPVALHLLPWEGLLVWSQRMEEGRLKHGPDNWRSGFPMSECFNRAVKHLYAYREKGDPRDLGAVMCNVAFMAYFAVHRPDLNDLGHPQTVEQPEDVTSDTHLSMLRQDVRNLGEIAKDPRLLPR